MPLPPTHRDQHLAFALELARAPQEALLRAFAGQVRAQNKAGEDEAFDPVTSADKDAESLMRGLIRARYPEHGILGEEFGADETGRDFVWVLDPIDGTRAFLCGLPGWTTLVALLHEGRPVAGVIHAPVMDLTLAGDGETCWRIWRGERTRAKVSATTALQRALAGTTLPRLYDTPARACFLKAVQGAARHVQFDADALFYALLASGRMDLVFDTQLAPYDAAALIPVVLGAGGVLTDWQGRAPRLSLTDEKLNLLAAATTGLHAQALKLLAQCGAQERT